jgi:hypothetical protein
MKLLLLVYSQSLTGAQNDRRIEVQKAHFDLCQRLVKFTLCSSDDGYVRPLLGKLDGGCKS